MSYADDIHEKAIDLAKLTVRMTAEAGSGHPPSGLSLAHIATVLLYDVMRWRPEAPWHRGRDRLILSEGHAVPFVYAACCGGDVLASLGLDASSLSERVERFLNS